MEDIQIFCSQKIDGLGGWGVLGRGLRSAEVSRECRRCPDSRKVIWHDEMIWHGALKSMFKFVKETESCQGKEGGERGGGDLEPLPSGYQR